MFKLAKSDNLVEELVKELSQVRTVELSEPRLVFDTFSELIVGVQPMSGPANEGLVTTRWGIINKASKDDDTRD